MILPKLLWLFLTVQLTQIDRHDILLQFHSAQNPLKEQKLCF